MRQAEITRTTGETDILGAVYDIRTGVVRWL